MSRCNLITEAKFVPEQEPYVAFDGKLQSINNKWPEDGCVHRFNLVTSDTNL